MITKRYNKVIAGAFSFLLLLSSFLFSSCKEDNNSAAEGTDREFMTMFINDNNRGKGGDYPYNCGLDGAYPHGNTIHLYWYGVKDCAGYQIQMAIQNKVSGGSTAWANVQGTSDLLLDTIVGPKQLDMLIKDLQRMANESDLYGYCEFQRMVEAKLNNLILACLPGRQEAAHGNH